MEPCAPLGALYSSAHEEGLTPRPPEVGDGPEPLDAAEKDELRAIVTPSRRSKRLHDLTLRNALDQQLLCATEHRQGGRYCHQARWLLMREDHLCFRKIKNAGADRVGPHGTATCTAGTFADAHEVSAHRTAVRS